MKYTSTKMSTNHRLSFLANLDLRYIEEYFNLIHIAGVWTRGSHHRMESSDQALHTKTKIDICLLFAKGFGIAGILIYNNLCHGHSPH